MNFHRYPRQQVKSLAYLAVRRRPGKDRGQGLGLGLRQGQGAARMPSNLHIGMVGIRGVWRRFVQHKITGHPVRSASFSK